MVLLINAYNLGYKRDRVPLSAFLHLGLHWNTKYDQRIEVLALVHTPAVEGYFNFSV